MAHILIVSAPFYKSISTSLTKAASEVIHHSGSSFDVVEVPGAFEIAGAIAMASHNNQYDGYIGLGCVIRGETTHYDYVCNESARGIMDLTIVKQLAIGYGIITAENKTQAEKRKTLVGTRAANACITMINLRDRFGL